MRLASWSIERNSLGFSFFAQHNRPQSSENGLAMILTLFETFLGSLQTV